jgi:hypothetical protein
MPDEKKYADETSSRGLVTIEELRKATGTSVAIHAGVVESKRWAAGKKVSQSDYKAAVAAFTGAPIGGKTAVKQVNKEV